MIQKVNPHKFAKKKKKKKKEKWFGNAMRNT